MVGDKDIEVEDYKYFGHNREGLHIKAPKGSGGVGILVRNDLLLEYNVINRNIACLKRVSSNVIQSNSV